LVIYKDDDNDDDDDDDDWWEKTWKQMIKLCLKMSLRHLPGYLEEIKTIDKQTYSVGQYILHLLGMSNVIMKETQWIVLIHTDPVHTV
jgi:hypothetical protein